jgi:NADH:ubiquinone oxidoreductase subunit 3 (subunit A)
MLGVGIEIVNNLINIIIYLMILLGSSVLTASAAAYIFQERELGVKQLQLASGTNPKIYWLSNFIWDFVLHLIIFIVIFIIANAVSWSTFGGVRIVAEIILIILYSLASVSIAYFFSFVFSGPGSGIGSLLGLFIGIGFGFLAITNAIGGTSTDAAEAISALGYVFKAFRYK